MQGTAGIRDAALCSEGYCGVLGHNSGHWGVLQGAAGYLR